MSKASEHIQFLQTFWMPDQVRHDEKTEFVDTLNTKTLQASGMIRNITPSIESRFDKLFAWSTEAAGPDRRTTSHPGP